MSTDSAVCEWCGVPTDPGLAVNGQCGDGGLRTDRGTSAAAFGARASPPGQPGFSIVRIEQQGHQAYYSAISTEWTAWADYERCRVNELPAGPISAGETKLAFFRRQLDALQVANIIDRYTVTVEDDDGGASDDPQGDAGAKEALDAMCHALGHGESGENELWLFIMRPVQYARMYAAGTNKDEFSCVVKMPSLAAATSSDAKTSDFLLDYGTNFTQAEKDAALSYATATARIQLNQDTALARRLAPLLAEILLPQLEARLSHGTRHVYN